MSIWFALVLAAPLTGPVQQADEEAFQARLLEVEGGLRAGEWRETPARIAALLEQHEGRPYVWLSRPRLVEALRLAAFLPGYEPRRPEELVQGKLERYSPSTGKLRLVYRQGQLGEFLVVRESGVLEPASDAPLGEEDLLLHPAEFRRGCSVTVRGEGYGRGGTLPDVVCYLPTRILLVSFGQTGLGRNDRPALLVDLFRQEVLDRAVSPARRGESYAFEVQVKEREVLGLWKNRRVLRAKKERDEFGRFGIRGVSGWEQIEVEGVASRAWMRGLQDGAFQRDLLAFAETFDERAALPAWLHFERVEWAELMARSLPGSAPAAQGEHVRALLRLLDEEDERGARRLLADLGSGVGQELRAYLACLLELELRNLDAAGEHCQELRELDPGFLTARFLEVWIGGLRDDPEQACRRFAELALDVPGDPALRGAQALFALATGDREQADEVLRLAVAAGLYGQLLDEVSTVLCKALTGPSWLESHVVETEHFRVVSDIDERTCREAADILETALEHFQSRHRPLPQERVERFPVYLFSGEAGYQVYLVHTTLFPAESSAGAFVPGMGQLLIWNAPDRAKMLDTVRHEGLHQYMHRLTRDQPVWLAEGLGEYWEEADFTKSKSLQNLPSRQKLLAVRALRKDFLPLERFLRVARGEFYADASLSYTQAWAFVHFLQHSGREHQQLFDALLDELTFGADAEDAVEAVFGGQDLQELDEAFGRYLRELR